MVGGGTVTAIGKGAWQHDNPAAGPRAQLHKRGVHWCGGAPCSALTSDHSSRTDQQDLAQVRINKYPTKRERPTLD